MTTTSTKETAQGAASTAAEQGRHVADVATEEAQNVAGEAAAQARHLIDETITQVGAQMKDQSRVQRDRLVGTLQTFSDDLEQMTGATQRPGLATDIIREVAHRARSLGSALDGREPQELLGDVRRFARRRPGTFLLGALAAGMAAGRVVRGAKQGASGGGAVVETSSPGLPAETPAAPSAPSPETHEVISGGHGQPTVEPPADPVDAGPQSATGTEPAGYGQRGTLDGGPR